MKEERKSSAALRLQKLSTQLKTAYERAGDHITETLWALEEAVADIDEPWAPKHFVEMLRTEGPNKARRPESCFASESFANGDKADYALCVARKHNRRCGLHVSYCQYRVKNTKDIAGKVVPNVTIRDTFLILPEKLPVPLRLKILDVLDPFAEAYEQHVRSVRHDILDDFGEEGAFGSPAFDATPASAVEAKPPFAPQAADEAEDEPAEAPRGRWVKSLAPPEAPEPAAQDLKEDLVSAGASLESDGEPEDDDTVMADVPDPLDETVMGSETDEPREDQPAEKPRAKVSDQEEKPELSVVELKNESADDKDAKQEKNTKKTRSKVKLADIEANIPLQAWV